MPLSRCSTVGYSWVMNLHRIEGDAEWVTVPAAQRNVWQRTAAATIGVVTIGNFFSLLGLASVPYGLWLIAQQRYVAGIAVLTFGRICDLLDGWLADKTGTKSPLGERIDAAFDKISLGLVLLVLLVSGILPWWALVLLILPHLIVAFLAVIAWRRGQVLHPSRTGKLSMALVWVVIAAFIVAYMYRQHDVWMIRELTAILTGISAGLGATATLGYIQEFRQLK
jgi:phosphatidylglycerophosphate synthase